MAERGRRALKWQHRMARERLALVLMAAFAIVAVALAAIGLYGVLAYSVRQRTQEFGIRMALGATTGHVRSLVLRQAAVIVGVGVALGTIETFAPALTTLNRLTQRELGVSRRSPYPKLPHVRVAEVTQTTEITWWARQDSNL